MRFLDPTGRPIPSPLSGARFEWAGPAVTMDGSTADRSLATKLVDPEGRITRRELEGYAGRRLVRVTIADFPGRDRVLVRFGSSVSTDETFWLA